jgi:pyridinium-3,5-bisthiocarboxylic acid mononucleotide nickel chelatase
MKIAYFDCFSGVSGDMILGALIDAGLDPDDLRKVLAGISLSGYEITAEKVVKNGITGTRFNVITSGTQRERNLSDILKIINESSFKEPVKKSAGEIFRNIARVEAKIHNKQIEDIHFHEIGAVDSIIDIVGACAALDMMGIEAVQCSRINVGEGFVKSEHGLLPVPAPATASLLLGVPIYSSGVQAELATPTGAAIIAHFARRYGPLPDIKVRSVGYGAGMKDLPVPNLLRVYIGDDETQAGNETIIALETNIDDMNPEFYQHVFERLLESGALDVFTTPVIMKKTRPGVQLTVLAREDSRDKITSIIFDETTTAGIRISRMDRVMLEREIRIINTRYGEVIVKFLYSGGRVVTVSPEYEDCRRIAKAKGIPLKAVYDEAKKMADSAEK